MEMMIYSILSTKGNPKNLVDLLIDIKGISEGVLSFVSFKDITAVVSAIKKNDINADRANAIIYAGIIEILTQRFTLLPVRYGSVMESTSAIIKMLERNYNEIQNNLQKVEDKWEFGLRIFCDSEKLKTELRTKSEADPQSQTIESTDSVYRDWVNRKLKEHRLEESLLTYIESIIAEIKVFLDSLNAVTKFKKMLTATTLLDAVFLLDKDQKDTSVYFIEDLQTKYPALTFVLTGPWPPYNFVEITIK